MRGLKSSQENVITTILSRTLVGAWIEISLFCKETIADGGCSSCDCMLFSSKHTGQHVINPHIKKIFQSSNFEDWNIFYVGDIS